MGCVNKETGKTRTNYKNHDITSQTNKATALQNEQYSKHTVTWRQGLTEEQHKGRHLNTLNAAIRGSCGDTELAWRGR